MSAEDFPMLQLLPNRQLAHDLIERVTPGQLAIITCLLKTMITSNEPELSAAPFSEEQGTASERRAGPVCLRTIESTEPRSTFGLQEDDSDFWPAPPGTGERLPA